MIDFVVGVVLGAAFSPFWMKVWEWIKPKVLGFFSAKDENK